jgi:pimeloyl-ACP methyl ester carboxylesterase/predicted lipid carrier protein YhbT
MTALVDPLPSPLADRDEVLGSLLALPDRYRRLHAPRTPRRYRVTVEDAPPHVVAVDRERCVVYPSASERVDAEIRTDADSWLGISAGETDGLEAFLAGRLRIRGDLNEALRLETLFTLPEGSPRWRTRSRMGRYQVGRASLSTFETGPVDGPLVVMIHGLGASKVSLLPAIAGLATTHRVVAVDLPGFGKSTAPLGAAYDAPYFAGKIVGLLDALGARDAVLVGNSLGGRVAVEVALSAPARVRGLGLLCPALAFDAYRLLRPGLSVSRADVLAGLPLWPLPKGLVDLGLRRMFADHRRVPADNLRAARDDFLRSIRAPARRLAFLATARHLALETPKRYWPRLADLDAPSLWLFGDSDRLVPGRYAEVVRRSAPPSARVELWTDSGHVPQFEHPARTIAALRGLLAEVDGQARTGGAELVRTHHA